MLKKAIIAILIVSSPGFYSLIPYSGGSPGGRTGSPADGSTCTQCHGGTASSVEDWISATIPDTGYIPGETYTITATGTYAGVSRFGFELTCEDGSKSKKGVFTITNTNETKLTNSNAAVTHKLAGVNPTDDSKTWTCNWTAPEAGSGDLVFYAAFNAANGNGSTSGDVIYTSRLVVEEYNSSGINIQEDEILFRVFQSSDPNSLIVEYTGKPGPQFEIRAFDLSGRIVLTEQGIPDSKNRIRLDISSLGSNAYIFQILDKDFIKSQKVFIAK